MCFVISYHTHNDSAVTCQHRCEGRPHPSLANGMKTGLSHPQKMKKGTSGKKLDAEDHWRSKVLRNWCGYLREDINLLKINCLFLL